MKNTSEKRRGKHHYVPELQLKHWADINGKIGVWRRVRPGGKLTFVRKSPSAVAYRHGLYALRGLEFRQSQKIENEILANTIEHQADKVLSKLNSIGLSSLTFQEFEWWAIFLNSSVFRLPHVLESLGERVRNSVFEGFSEAQEEYESVEGNSPPDTLLQWVQDNCPQEIANLDIEAMLHLFAKQDNICRILQLTWMVIDLTGCGHPLLLGDCPVLRSGSLWQSNALIAMPLSPNKLFLAVGDECLAQRIGRLKAFDLAVQANIQSLSSSRVYTFGDSEREFVDVYLT